MTTELEALERDRAHLARRVAAPPWYQPLVGLLVAQHIAVQGLAQSNWTLPSGVLLIGGSAAAWLGWRRHMGLTIGPWTGSTSRGMLALWSLAVLLCVWAAAAWPRTGVVVALTVVGFGSSVALGRLYEMALRRDLSRS